ncbi:MAG: hypothetical protein EOP58_04695, partial [Sphingomonadales bacterium]
MAVSLDVSSDVTLDIVSDTDNDGVADAGETVRGVITITHTGSTDALGVAVADTLDGLSLVPGSVTITPIAVNDSFTITGNTPITLTAAQLLGNDLDPDGNSAGLSITAITAGTNGAVVDNGNGTFTFTPSTGFNGAASFQYTVTDEDGLASVSQGTVSIAVTGLTWYVNGAYDGSQGASDGSYTRPFVSLANVNGGNGDGSTNDDVDGAGDTIFVYSGTYTGGIVLEAGQHLYGDGHAYSVNGNTIGNSASNSQINYTDYGVIASSNNEISGVTLNGTANGALGLQDSVNVGTLTITNTSIIGAGRAVALDNGGTLAVSLDTLSSANSGTNGVQIQNMGGSFSATGGSITGAVNGGVLIGGANGGTPNSGGNVNFTYGGTVGGNGGNTIEIQDRTGGNVTFSGTVIDSADGRIVADGNAGTINFSGSVGLVTSGSVNAVTLTNNSGTINFTNQTDGLDISTLGSGVGLTFTGGGTLNITGAGNTLSTGTGALVNMANGTIGADGVTFATMTSGSVTGNAFGANNVDGGTFTGGNLTVTGATLDGINIQGGSSTNFAFTSTNISGVSGDDIEINNSSGNFTSNGGALANSGGRGVAVIDGTGG